MVTHETIEQQLKKIGFKTIGWGRTEVNELPNIILPDEEIKECVNGLYEGGFALLIATNIRVLLVDKKPMNYLTVEDLRFDMINEIDYSHRLFGARISISTGSKNLRFTSLNQPRLRELIGHVQHCMAEAKLKQSEHQEDQKLHLEQINQQLQTYLLAQHQQQQKLQAELNKANGSQTAALAELTPIKPDPRLADYLYAQNLLANYQAATGQTNLPALPQQSVPVASVAPASSMSVRPGANDLYAEGVREIFGDQQPTADNASSFQQMATSAVHHALEVNPLKVAYSKLPLAMRNRKFGRPSFHDHSANEPEMTEALPQQPSVASEY